MAKKCLNSIQFLTALILMGFTTAAYAVNPKPPDPVEVVNVPSVNVATMPDVNVANTPDVTVVNTPDVIVANTGVNPIPVTVESAPAANPNPLLPENPIFAWKNAEGGNHPILFGPFSADTRIAIGSFTFDGGGSGGSQVDLVITDCEGNWIDWFVRWGVKNFAAGLGPQHMVFPVPIVLPLEDPGVDWCLVADPTLPYQVLVTAVGYVIE